MGFRTLLAAISERYPRGREFTSSEFASSLRLPKKRTSNDLRRLHRMGFLNGRRRPRHMAIWSKPPYFIWCNKGYEYVYAVSKQGQSYLQWMIGGRKKSEGQKELDFLARLCNEDLRTERMRERLRELDRQSRKGHDPTPKLELTYDPTNDVLEYCIDRSAKLKSENEWLTRELIDGVTREHRAQDRANQVEATFNGFVIPTIKWLTDENRALREAAADPRPILELEKSLLNTGRLIGRSEAFQEARQSLERMYDRLCARQLPASHFLFGKQYSGLEHHRDFANTQATDKGLPKSEVEESPVGKP